MPLDEELLRAHPRGVAVLLGRLRQAERRRRLAPRRATGGRSLVLNGHIDVVARGRAASGARRRSRAVRDGDWLYGRGCGDMKAGLAAIVGAVAGLRAARPRAARPGAAAVGRRGGVRRERRAAVRPLRAASRRGGHPRAVPGARSRPRRSACSGSTSTSPALPAHVGRCPGRLQRDRGVVRGRDGAATRSRTS